MNASTSRLTAPAANPVASLQVGRQRRPRWAAITGALLCLAAQMQSQAQAQTATPRATVQVLPTLGGNYSAARGVNDLGQVVGSSSDGTVARGFLWQAGSGMQALTPAGGFGDAMAINNAGQVAGRYLLANRSAPFLWSASTGLRVLPVPSGEPNGAASALNEAGVAAGYWSGPFVDRGIRWGNDGSLLELLPQNNQVTGINDAGQMVGGPSGGVGYLWQADGTVMTLPSLDSTRPLAPRDINNLGVVVGAGAINNAGTLQAFAWQAATGTRSLGHLGAGTSAALALNDFGQVVGSSRLAGGSADVAMLWREGAGMSNLSALAGAGVNPYEATGINSFAQVVGTASTSAGSRAFLMTLHPDWNGGDGAWDDSTGQRWNWAGTGTAAARVGAMHDVVIDPGRSATVRGSADGQARSLRIGGTAGHLVTLDLNGGTTRLSDGNAASFTESAIGSGGVLRGSGRMETSDDLRVRAGGRIEVGAGEHQQLAVAYLDNQGTVRAQGTAYAPAQLQVTGGAFYTQAGARLQLQYADAVLASGLSNFGEVSLQTAQISMPEGLGARQLFNAGTLAFTFGDSSITGKVTNNGLLVVSNGARASFFGSVVHRGELRVSAGGAASFFGRVEGTGALTGTGEVRFEGGLALGGTPTVLYVNPRSVVASEVALTLGGGPPEAAGGQAGTAGAPAHDRIVFNGAVLLEGATLSLADGSALAASLAAGSAFDLFDWNGGVNGSFITLALPALAVGLAWDTSDLYAGGGLSVTAVPEPATWALMVGAWPAVCCADASAPALPPWGRAAQVRRTLQNLAPSRFTFLHPEHPMNLQLQQMLAGMALSLGLSMAAQAQTVFNYGFESGPAGVPVASVVDSGPNALNGSATGLVYTDQVAAGGGSFALDARGDFNFARVADNPLMHLQTFTLSLQARPDEACTGPSNFCFIAIKKISDSGNFLSNYGLYYTAEGRFAGEIGYGNGQGLTLTSTDSYALGSGWHNVALLLDRNVDGALDRASLYVNGQLQAALLAELPTLGYTGGDFLVGAGNFLGSASSEFRRNFNGGIDNVQLLSVAVTVPEPGSAVLLVFGLAGLLLRRENGRHDRQASP